ncbi:MAG: hypothetical protein LBS32_04725, partial [Clostridiales Family XIII bacterium]|nr:hypothetical protein [Clostridiales Family XIII bacterium]
ELAGLERIDSPKPYYGSRYTDSTRNYLAKAVDEFWYYDLGDLGYTFSAYPAGGGRSSRKTVFSPSAMGAKQQYYAFMGGDYPYCRIDREAAGGRRIAVVKDSYANAFIPWLIPHFEQIHVIDPRHYEGSLQSLVRDEGITDLLFMDYALVLGIPPYAEAIRGILQ